MQSSTSSVQQSIRRTWRTFSERPPRKLWPFNENRRPTRGRRNVWFCKVRRKRNMFLRTPPSSRRAAQVNNSHRWMFSKWRCSVTETVWCGNGWYSSRLSSCESQAHLPSNENDATGKTILQVAAQRFSWCAAWDALGWYVFFFVYSFKYYFLIPLFSNNKSTHCL